MPEQCRPENDRIPHHVLLCLLFWRSSGWKHVSFGQSDRTGCELQRKVPEAV